MGNREPASYRPGANSFISTLAPYLALFFFLSCIYLVTYSARFNSSDGLAMFATAESLVRRGAWDADQIRWMGLQQGIFGSDGHLYVRKGVGMSLLVSPLVWLGWAIPGWGMASTALIFNALVTAATGALLLNYLCRLGYQFQVALAAALIFGLATPAWPYAKSFFSDPLAGLCLLAAALALLCFHQARRAPYAFAAGLALAVAVSVRYANVVLIPLYGLLLVGYLITSPLAENVADSQASATGLLSRNWQAWVAFLAPLVVAGLAMAYHNFARYGDPLNSGYLPEESFSGIWWQGIAGLLISPGRGLFLYAPVLLIALPAAPIFFRQHRPEAILAGAIIVAHVLLYGKWFMWHGGYAWGPRFLVPTLPFFVILMAPGIERARKPGWWRWSLLVLAIISGLIQLLGLSVPFELFQNRLLDTDLPLFAPVTFFAARYSPLIGQLQFLRLQNLDFAWMSAGQVYWPLLIVLVVAAIASGWELMQAGRLMGGRREKPGFPQTLHLVMVQTAILPALLAIIATGWLLAYVPSQHPNDLRKAVEFLNTRLDPDDAVVTGTPPEAPTFADLYKRRAYVLGLEDGPRLDADTETALAEAAHQHPRIWWFPTWLPAEQSPVEQWLMRHGFRVENLVFGNRRLVLFYFPSQPLTETRLDTTFGNSILLESAGTSPGAQPGSVLPVELRWQAKLAVLEDFNVFVHLLDAQGQRVAQSDGQPALWSRPTSAWLPGDRTEDRHALLLPADLPAGDYTLIAGLYRPQDGERLLGDKGTSFAVIGTVHITDKPDHAGLPN